MGRNKPGPRHLFIPDTQVKPGVNTDHIVWAARYAAVKQPDTIVLAGDWYDMPSLSIYDEGKRAMEGRRYEDDIEAGNLALYEFDRILKKHAPRSYSPRKLVTLGNHEQRIESFIERNPKMAEKISLNDLAFKEQGWTPYPFLQPVEVDGITYMHYCPLNARGHVSASKYGAPSALAQARRMMRSTVCGHRQGLDVDVVATPGRNVRGVIAGSFYSHQEEYLTRAGTTYWRGILVFNDIRPKTGEFDICEVSMPYLERRFG
jgi:hypothetical protein